MTLKDQINNKIENLRRKLKRHIEKTHREGDCEKETELRRELEATYKIRRQCTYIMINSINLKFM